jgi:hypothetical protein
MWKRWQTVNPWVRRRPLRAGSPSLIKSRKPEQLSGPDKESVSARKGEMENDG